MSFTSCFCYDLAHSAVERALFLAVEHLWLHKVISRGIHIFYSESRDVFVFVSADVRLRPHLVTGGRRCLSGRHQVGFACSNAPASFPGLRRGDRRCGKGNACGPGCS